MEKNKKTIVYLRQDFEDADIFNPGKIAGGEGDPESTSGAIGKGQNDPAFEIVGNPVKSGKQALKISRIDTLRYLHFFRDQPLPQGHDFTVSFWCHAKENSNMALFLYPDQKAGKKPLAGISVLSNYHLRIYNPAIEGINKWVPTVHRIPASTWFRCILRFDVVRKLYWCELSTENADPQKSEPYPFSGDQPPWALQLLNVPPAGNSVVIDDLEISYAREMADTARGRKNWAPDAVFTPRNLNFLADGNKTKGMEPKGDKLSFDLEFSTARPVEMIRLYSGRPDGSGRLAAGRIEGVNTAGHAPELNSGKMAIRPDFTEYTFRRERLTSIHFALQGKAGENLFLREVEIYAPPPLPSAFLDAAFIKSVYGEFRLPVYEDQKVANLHLFNIREDGGRHRVGITLSERFEGKKAYEQQEIDLPPGETKVPFQITNLADGSYIATVSDLSSDHQPGRKARFRRLLRIQHSVPCKRATGYEMTGNNLFFPDDHYLSQHHNVSFASCKGQLVEAVKPVLKSADFTQLGRQIYFDPNGRLSILFRRLNRRWMKEPEHRDFIAVAEDKTLESWKISRLKEKPTIPPQGEPVWGSPPALAKGNWGAKRLNNQPIPLRFYRPETDGSVTLNQVAFRRISRSAKGTIMHRGDLDWSALPALAGSVWPIWFKAPGVGLVLTREPLLLEAPGNIGEMEDPKDANDNWAGQFLSDDGRTLSYIHANILRRYPPFNAPWDNLAKSARILTLYRTTDGIHYQRSHIALPREQDPPASQHYGASIRWAANGNGLRLAYLLRYKAYTQQIDTVISYSWDGIQWKRFHGGAPLATNGPHKSWTAGHVWPGYSAVERNGKVYHLIQRAGGIYHFQSEIANSRTDETIKQVTGKWMNDHYGPRKLESCPLFPLFGSWANLAKHTRNTGVGVGVLIYRKNGLFCLSADDKGGNFQTLPLRARGTLKINAEVAEGGFLQLELTDKAGTPLPGYSGTKGIQLEAGDYLDAFFPFGTQTQLPEGEFRIFCKLSRTKLYTIGFE